MHFYTRHRSPAFRFALLALIAVPLALALTACLPEPANASETASGLRVPEKQQAEKLNAYVVAYNKLLQYHDFRETLRNYRQSNPDLRKADVPLKHYDFTASDLDTQLRSLEQAMAVPQSLPELDEVAKVLKAALEAANPLIKDAAAYEKSKEYLSDKGAKARAMDAPLTAALNAAGRASNTFGGILSQQTLKRDEAGLASLKFGTVGFHKLKVSLEVRKLATAIKVALGDRQQVPGIQAPLMSLSEANNELGTLRHNPKAQPAWDPVCAMYKTEVDGLIGFSRTLLSALDGRRHEDIDTAATAWFTARNKTIDAANRCGS